MDAVKALAALAQETRLNLYRTLVRHGPDGLPAGELATRLNMSPSGLSFHLKALAEAGLVVGTPEGRFVRYHAHIETMQALIDFLSAECCDGQPEACFQRPPLSCK